MVTWIWRLHVGMKGGKEERFYIQRIIVEASFLYGVKTLMLFCSCPQSAFANELSAETQFYQIAFSPQCSEFLSNLWVNALLSSVSQREQMKGSECLRKTQEKTDTVFVMGINTWCLLEYRPSFSLPLVCKLYLRITQPQVPVLCAAPLPHSRCPLPAIVWMCVPRVPLGIFLVPLWRATNLHTSFVPHYQPHVFSSSLRFLLPPDLLPLGSNQQIKPQPSQTIRPAQGKSNSSERHAQLLFRQGSSADRSARELSTVLFPLLPSQRSVGVVVRAG